MLPATLRDDVTAINRALDKFETTRDPERRRERLEQALLASSRAIEAILIDEDLLATLRAGHDLAGSHREEVSLTVQDAMLFAAFLQAERRLFLDLGLDASAADRLVNAMRGLGPSADPDLPDLENIESQLRGLIDELGEARERIHEEERHEHHRRLVRRVFLVVGGVFVIGANVTIGSATAPITGGLSLAGAAVSSAIGGVMLDRGFPD